MKEKNRSKTKWFAKSHIANMVKKKKEQSLMLLFYCLCNNTALRLLHINLQYNSFRPYSKLMQEMKLSGLVLYIYIYKLCIIVKWITRSYIPTDSNSSCRLVLSDIFYSVCLSLKMQSESLSPAPAAQLSPHCLTPWKFFCSTFAGLSLTEVKQYNTDCIENPLTRPQLFPSVFNDTQLRVWASLPHPPPQPWHPHPCGWSC